MGYGVERIAVAPCTRNHDYGAGQVKLGKAGRDG